MKKIQLFISLFLFIFSLQGYSQNLIEVELLKKCKENRFSSITQLMESYLLKKDTKQDYIYKTNVNEELIDSYYQTSIVFSIQTYLTNQNSYSSVDYTINIIHKNDTSIFWNLFLNRSKVLEQSRFATFTTDDNLLISKDSSSSELQKLKDTYKLGYGYTIITAKLFKSDESFGYKCGFGHTKPKTRLTLDELVSNDASQVILNWLKAPNVVYQLYALDGLHNLQKSNFTLDETTEIIVNKFYKKKGVIKVCLESENALSV